MSDAQDKLRAEFRSDIRELKSDFQTDLNAAVSRIEASIKAHSDSSAARQSELVARIQSHDDRQTASFTSMMEWRILVEKRLAEQTQISKISSGVFGAVGAALLTFLVRLFSYTPNADPLPPVAPISGESPQPAPQKLPNRRN
jgi:hypothetical protein